MRWGRGGSRAGGVGAVWDTGLKEYEEAEWKQGFLDAMKHAEHNMEVFLAAEGKAQAVGLSCAV